jgi:hypothetical protein
VEAQEKRARAFAASVYLAIGSFAVAVGAHDAVIGAEIGSRASGMVLLLGGLALIAIAIALMLPVKKWSQRRRWVPRAGVYVAGVGVLIGGSLIFAQAFGPEGTPRPVMQLVAVAILVAALAYLGRGLPELVVLSLAMLTVAYAFLDRGEHDGRVIVWGAIVIASGLAALALWRTNPPRIGLAASRLVLGLVGFFSLSAVIGVAQFWYTTQYLPANERVSLSVESTLRRLDSSPSGDVMELVLTVRNTSQVPAEILGSVYRISGSNALPIAASDRAMRGRFNRLALNGETVTRYRRQSDWDLVQAGRIFGFGWWLDAEEEFTRVAVIRTPHDRYDTLRSQAEILLAKQRSLNLGYENGRSRFLKRARWHVRGFKLIWPIEETSWFRDLTRDDREVQVKWITAMDGEARASRFPRVRGVITQAGEEASPEELLDYGLQTADLYGLTKTVSTREVALDIRP